MFSDLKILKRVRHEVADGRLPIQYRIQLVDESLANEAASFWAEYLYPRESLALVIDERFGKEEIGNKEFISGHLSKGISLAAVLEDDQRNTGALIGCSVLCLKRRDHSKLLNTVEDSDSENVTISLRFKTMIQTMEAAAKKADVFTIYDCSSYMYGVGLAVAPQYVRRGIAGELLRVRGEVCRLTNTPVSASVFTGEASQRAATSCGFQTLSELDLRSYRSNGEIVYPSPKWPVIKCMAKRYF